MPVLLNWNDTNQTEDGHRVYRSTSPMDVNALPAPLVELGPDITSYQDDAVTDGVTYYYIVSAFKGASEAFSGQVSVLATQQNIPTTGLELWYKFSDVSGSLVPDSAGNNDGSLVANATVVPGELGDAIDFDGSGDYIDTGYKTDAGGSYTISAWVNIRSLGGSSNNPALYFEGGNTSNSYGALIWIIGTTGILEFGHMKSVGGDYDAAGVNIAPYVGELIHLCAVRENGVENRLYIDKQLVASEPCARTSSPPTYTGALGGDPRYASSPPRWFDGLIERDFRIYNRALAANEVQQLFEEHQQVAPFTLDENFVFTDEGDDAAPWSAYKGSAPISQGGEIVLAAGAASSNSTTYRAIDPLPAGGDAVIYLKMRSTVAAAGSDKHTYLNLSTGGSTNAVFYFHYGYDWVQGVQVPGTVSVWANNGAYKIVLEQGVDYSVAREYAIHVDRDHSAVSFYRMDTGEPVLLGSIPFFSALDSVNELQLRQGTDSGDLEVALDYFSIARPNFVSIGDSIAAGHNHFDPDPDFHAGVDDVKNSWQGHWTYSGLRNNFMVNKGMGSQTSAQILSRISEATAHGARYVFLHASTNDHGAGITQLDRTNNIQGTVDAIVSSGARCVLVNAIYVNSNHGSYPASGDYMKDWWDNYRSGLTGTYQQIDTMAVLADVSGYIDPAYCESDGVHPNATGYGVMGDYFETQFTHTA